MRRLAASLGVVAMLLSPLAAEGQQAPAPAPGTQAPADSAQVSMDAPMHAMMQGMMAQMQAMQQTMHAMHQMMMMMQGGQAHGGEAQSAMQGGMSCMMMQGGQGHDATTPAPGAPGAQTPPAVDHNH